MYCKMSNKSTHHHHHHMLQQRWRCFSSHPATKIRTHCCCFLAIMTTISLLVLVNCDNSNISGTPVQEIVNLKQVQTASAHLLQPRDAQEHYSYLATKNSRQRRFLQQRQTQQVFYEPSPSMRSASNNNVAQLSSMNLEAGPREDICNKHCSCAKVKNSFNNITCDFQMNRNLSPDFDKNFRVPKDALSIRIILAADTKFTLHQGFFDNNLVNSFIIEGANSSHNQVEITSEAFSGNRGPNPEIQINNVFSVIVRRRAFTFGSLKFTVRNSKDLILYDDSFVNTSIFGYFLGIDDLRIMEKAFNAAEAVLRIENSNIDNMYRFEASLHEISFINCTIGTINGGTFDVNNILSLRFEYCRIDAIKSRAITEKFFSSHVSISDAKIGIIESEAIHGSGITKLLIMRNNIETIHANAIHVNAVDVVIVQNNIKHLDNNWLRVQEWSNITVAKNRFGVFGRMLLENTAQQVTCRFDGNSITTPLPGSLNITNLSCILHEITINMPCRCNSDWLYALSSQDLRPKTFCTVDDKLSICFNASTFNTLTYLQEVCDEKKSVIDCVANRNLKKVDGRFFTMEELESRSQRLPHSLMILVAGVLFLMAILVTACIFIYRACSTHRKEGQGVANIPHARDHLHEFSMEDRYIIEQSLQHMQKKYPNTYKKVNAEIQVLLQNDLSDKKCRKVIIEIVHLLNNLSNACDDFAPFNNILAQHLQPQLPTAPPADPIYTEPGFTGTERDMYILNTGQAPYAVNDSNPATTTVLNEHIYAEPNCAQQPLLPNDYASPLDINMDSNEPYMEPINERGKHLPRALNATLPQNYPTPAARGQHSISSTASGTQNAATHMPDVLHQSLNTQVTNPKLTNVQKMAQHFQSMPKFHINQAMISSNPQRPNNLHLVAPPIYTVPDIEHKQQHRNIMSQKPVPMARLASPEAVDECELDMRGAAALVPDTGSDHSGGSNETVKMDDVIEYVDA